MAQGIGGTEGKGGEKQLEFDLREHLLKYNVPDRIFNLLKQDSITIDELSTFRTKDLDIWSDENHLRAIERRRFINAVKSLPNSQAGKPDIQPKIVPVLIGNEEKEQLNQLQFDEMTNSVENMIHHINKLQNKSNVDKTIEEINSVCDEIQSFVETLRKNLSKQV